MGSETTIIATQYRLQEWAQQIKDCQNRPAGMNIASWCACHGITKANYYYRLRRVRKSCLEHLPEEMLPRQVVPVRREILQMDERTDGDLEQGLDVSIKGGTIHVTESTPMSLLSAVLKVVQNA